MGGEDDVRVMPLDADDVDAVETCAALLVDGFRRHWPEAWPTLDDARRELREALAGDRIALAARGGDERVLGWIGAIRAYDGRAWELHPMVVDGSRRRRGIGRALVEALEAEVRARGGGTLYLGTDDEDEMTSVGGVDLYPDVLGKLREIHDVRGHPFGFYRRLGFEVVGAIPDANGPGKPDILMAKRVVADG